MRLPSVKHVLTQDFDRAPRVRQGRENPGRRRGFGGGSGAPPATVFNEDGLLEHMRSIRALIVEDNATDRTYLRSMLQTLAPKLPRPLSVDEAESAEAAHALVGLGRYDVVIADYHLMGKSTGVDVLTRVQQLDESCLRFLVTGDARTTVAREALRGGAAHRVLVKTGGAKPILEELQRWFGSDAKLAT